jgi:branched-chain amino acid transport system ATP-binding protein
VEENLRIATYLRRDSEVKKSFEFVYTVFFHLKEIQKRKAGFCSGGEQQMLTIGRTLMGNPELILLDEPVEGLAPLVVKDFAERLLKLKEIGVTILFSEQNVRFSLSIADRAYVIDRGRIRYHGSIAELSANEEVKRDYLMI